VRRAPDPPLPLAVTAKRLHLTLWYAGYRSGEAWFRATNGRGPAAIGEGFKLFDAHWRTEDRAWA